MHVPENLSFGESGPRMVCMRISLVLVLYRNQNSSGIVNQILNHMEKRDTSHFGYDSREYRHRSPVSADFGGSGQFFT